MTDVQSTQSERRLPPDDLHVDYGEPCAGSSSPTPPDVRAAYAERIAASHEALAAGARLAGRLFVGGLT